MKENVMKWDLGEKVMIKRRAETKTSDSDSNFVIACDPAGESRRLICKRRSIESVGELKGNARYPQKRIGKVENPEKNSRYHHA